METTIKTSGSEKMTTTKKEKSNTVYPLWDTLEFNRFGIISMLVVILGCAGGIAASFGAGDNTLKLAMIAYPTIISLALILAVAKMRVIIYLSVIAIILDLIVLAF